MYLLIIILLLPFLCSCNNKKAEDCTVLSSLVGREIIFTENLSYQILGEPICPDLKSADYTIVAYIDSGDCTTCNMKLSEWNNVINQLNNKADVSFMMIINTDENNTKVRYNIRNTRFMHPVCFDSEGVFKNMNNLPDAFRYHTFLLNGNNEIIIVGNPVRNPKLLSLYKDNVSFEDDELMPSICHPIGAIHVGDTIVNAFNIHNVMKDPLTIQSIVPSCDCVSASISQDTILHDKKAVLSVKYIADSVSGYTKRYIDVYYNEKENPERYMLYGYVIK